MKIVFVAGTGTEVGKTYIAAKLARQARENGTRVGVYKPVASGCIRSGKSEPLVSEDALELWNAAGNPLDLDAVCPQRFEAPLAPNEAARREGKTVDEQQLYSAAKRWNDQCDLLIVEGAGGLFSPLSDHLLNCDLYRRFPDAELVLVAENRLGVIHDVIATVRAAQAEGLKVHRLYLSVADASEDPSRETNSIQIRQFCDGLEVIEVGRGQ